MLRRHKNLDARTLDLRSGKKAFLVRKAQFDEEFDDSTDEALRTPESVKGGELDYLEQLEYRHSMGEDLNPEEAAELEQLSTKYQDAMSRTVPTEFTEERPVDDEQFEEIPATAEEGAEARDKMRESESTKEEERAELRSLLLKRMWGGELSDEEEARVNTLKKQFPDMLKSMNDMDVSMTGMHRPESEVKRAPTSEEVSAQLGHPFDNIFVAAPLKDPDGQIKIDPEVASEEERLGADYGRVKYVPDFLTSDKHLREYRDWLGTMQVDPNMVSTNPLERVPSPPWYSVGPQDKSRADVADRTEDVVNVLKNVNSLSPEDVRVYGEMFNKILKDWPTYGGQIQSQVIPQFQEMLKTKFKIEPPEAASIATQLQSALTKEVPMSTHRVLEKADIIEQRLQRGEPVTQKDRAREYRRVQKIIDNLGQPLDLLGAASWLESIQNDGRWRNKSQRGTTPDGVQYTIDAPESLVAAYNFVAQSPLPDSVKTNVAKILTDRAPFKTFREKGRGNIGYSKLEQTMNMLSEFALGQYGLYNPDQLKNRKDLFKQDQQQRAEHKRLLDAHNELVNVLQKTFKLTHGEALDYIRNTVDGQDAWKQAMNERAGPKIERVREQYEAQPGPETRQFLGQFEYGLPEVFLIMSGAAKNRARYPDAPYIPLEGDEIDGRILDSLQRLWVDPGDKYGRDRLKKLFPGTMQVPTVVRGDPNKGEDPNRQYLHLQTRPKSDVTILQDPAVMMGISELIRRKRSKPEGGMRYTRQPKSPKRKQLPFSEPRIGLTLGKGLGLRLSKNVLSLRKKGTKAEEIFNMLADYSEAIGQGQPLSNLRRLLDPRLKQREKDESFRDDVEILLSELRAGTMDLGGYEFTIPQAARKDARDVYLDRSLSLGEKYEKLQGLKNRLSRPKTPEFMEEMRQYINSGGTTAPPTLEYSSVNPSAKHEFMDSVIPALDKGTPLAEKPEFLSPKPKGEPKKAPTPLREQREVPAPEALGPPVESRPISLPDMGVEKAPGTIDLNKMEEEIRGGTPSAPPKPRGREDIFDDAAYKTWEQGRLDDEISKGKPPGLTGFMPFEKVDTSPEKMPAASPAGQGEHPADSLQIGETHGEGWIKIPREMVPQVVGIAEVNRKVPVDRDYALVRAYDKMKQDDLLSEVSDFLLQEQGFNVGTPDNIEDSLDLSKKQPAPAEGPPVLSQDEINDLLATSLGWKRPEDDTDMAHEGSLSLRRISLCLSHSKK